MADSSLDLGTLAYTVTVKGADKAKQTMGELKEEIRAAEQEGQQSFDSLGEGGELAGKGIAAITAAAAVAVTALAKLTTESVKFADNWQGAMNDFQAQTGATSEEMAEFGDIAENIYNNNFGESINDIADAMANVKQQTGAAGDELERTTQNALMMRDTFGWEVQESVRAVDMMTKQFGITSDEAYTLLAQGAQNGLDKNDNLLDTLNEYSPHFAQLGFDAEETFGILAEGAEAGVFDIDKLGDAMKEFNIRVKDGSDATQIAFGDLGLDADLMQAKFTAGGQQAQRAFQQVVSALNNTEDAVTRNSVGVALFGTMWEDLEETTITAMLNANSAFDETAGTLQQIEAVKYNTISEALEGIGRNLETSILKPIGEALLPLLQKLADWINDHMDEITTVIEVTIEVISTVLGAFIALITADTEKLKEYITTALNTILELAKKVVTNTVNALKELPKQALNIGKQFVQGLIDGVGSMAGILVNAVRSLAAKALAAIRDAFDIHSPSRVMRDMMRDDVGGGMVLGLQDAVKPVSEAMQNLAGKAQAAISVNASGTISAMKAQAAGYTSAMVPALAGAGGATSYGDINIYIDKVNNSNGRDVETMARELEFFRRQQAGGKGGK